MSIWGMPTVQAQPAVTLIRWRVLRLSVKEVSIDLVLGWCIEDGHARMSTPIQDHDAQALTLITKSGRTYWVEGDSGHDDDAQYIFEVHFGVFADFAEDVSAEYFGSNVFTKRIEQP